MPDHVPAEHVEIELVKELNTSRPVVHVPEIRADDTVAIVIFGNESMVTAGAACAEGTDMKNAPAKKTESAIRNSLYVLPMLRTCPMCHK